MPLETYVVGGYAARAGTEEDQVSLSVWYDGDDGSTVYTRNIKVEILIKAWVRGYNSSGAQIESKQLLFKALKWFSGGPLSGVTKTGQINRVYYTPRRKELVRWAQNKPNVARVLLTYSIHTRLTLRDPFNGMALVAQTPWKQNDLFSQLYYKKATTPPWSSM